MALQLAWIGLGNMGRVSKLHVLVVQVLANIRRECVRISLRKETLISP
jgi:hypothetical protein